MLEKLADLKSWKKGPRPVPGELLQTLLSTYHLNPTQVDGMRMVERRGQFAGREVKDVIVFDPKAANGDVGSYADVDSGESQAILFRGHIEKGGGIDLRDVRPGKKSQDTAA